MPSRAVIKAAARAARQPTVAAPSLGSGVSPLMASYNNWGGNGRSAALPRDPHDFATGGFSPLTPIQPMGIDEPGDNADRPEPRRFQYPVAWNLIQQPGTEGLGKLADFATLRLLADYSSIARACIQLRKAEIRSLAWDIVPTKEASKDMRGDPSKHADFSKRRAQALKFFKRPDPGRYHDFSSWLDAVLEDIFVIDALSIYLQPTRGKGKGLLGSDLGALALVDGATLRPLVDLHGATPRPPSPAYQQYLYGAPRADLLTVINGDDLDELDQPVAEYRADQLLYLPMNPRDWTPYGTAPAERCIVPIMASLARQKWQADFYQEGTVPSVFVAPGDQSMTPGQIQELQAALNGIAGDPAWKHKIIVLPGGSTTSPMHATELADQFDEVIAVQVCMGYDVMPMELGISPKVSATQSIGAANQMAKASQQTNERKSLKPLLNFLKISIFDMVLQEICNQADMEFMWEGLEEGEDEEALTAILTQRVNNGLMSHDEARLELGLNPWGLPITADPGVMTPTGFIPLGAINPDTGKPDPVQPPQPGQAPEPGQTAPPAGGAPPAAGSANSATKPQTKPAVKPDRSSTPSHAGASAAMDEHDRQGSHQMAKPAGSASSAQPTASSKSDLPSRVRSLLEQSYPARVLGWVGDAEWAQDEVALADIDMARRPGGRDPSKVRGIASALRDGAKMDPVVLVQTPGNDKLVVADGYHRTLAFQHEDRKTIDAYVGTVQTDTGPWDRAMHDAKLNKAALAELDALGRHLKKGRDLVTWERRYLPAITTALLSEDLGKGLTIDQAVRVARSTLRSSADDDSEGEQPPFGSSAKSDKPARRPDGADWPGWQFDKDLAAQFAVELRLAMISALKPAKTARQIAEDWLAVASPGKSPQAWLQVTYPGLESDVEQALDRVLRRLWRRGWALGGWSARTVLNSVRNRQRSAGKASGQQSNQSDDSAGSASVVYDEQTYLDWLENDGIGSIQGIADTRMNDLAIALGDAMDEGWSSDRLAEEIAGFASDSASLDMIATTELARVVSQSALAAYSDAGVGQVSWLTAPGACKLCSDNEAASPITIDSSFPSGGTAPPGHPNCRCSLMPAELDGSDIAGLAMDAIS